MLVIKQLYLTMYDKRCEMKYVLWCKCTFIISVIFVSGVGLSISITLDLVLSNSGSSCLLFYMKKRMINVNYYVLW